MKSFNFNSRNNKTRDSRENFHKSCRGLPTSVKTQCNKSLNDLCKKAKLQPHRSIYWLNAKPDEKKEEQIEDICKVYHETINQEDELLMSVDEMTGIQALERISDELPMSEKKPIAIEFEYERHGTQTLIAGFNVKTGQTYGICGDTRKEGDFSSFI